MLVLGLDTSTSTGSIALLSDKGPVGERIFKPGLRHSETLLPTILEMIKEHHLTLEDINLISVGSGPGSFTGLRIGLSLAKGICLVTGAKLVGVSSLQAIAWSFRGRNLPVCATIDARRNQVYAAIFSDSGERLTDDMVMNPEELQKKIESKTILAGSGVREHFNVFKDLLGEKAEFCPEERDHPMGSAVAQLGRIKFNECGPDESATLAPTYVRKPDAKPA